MRNLSILLPLGLFLFTLGLACSSAEPEPSMALKDVPDRYVEFEAEELSYDDDRFEANAMEGQRAAKMQRAAPMPEASPSAGALMDEVSEEAPEEPEAPSGDDGGPSVRSWFPETFLWRPRVEVDGSAEIQVPLPDTLTTWRVLGLGASREGAQSGAVATFATRMDLYADPLMPPFLRQGDVLALPVQLVNTTDEVTRARLSVSATGLAGGATSDQQIAAGGSALVRAKLAAERPGQAVVRVGLEGADEVVRTLDIKPRGQRIDVSRSGVLGAGAAAALSPPAGARYARARLTLLPGPLGVVRSELTRGARGDVWDQAWRFDLGQRGAAALEALGAPPDEDTLERLRRIRLQALQGLVRRSFSSSLAERLLVLDAMGGAGDDPVAERAIGWVRPELIEAQLPDGTWSMGGRATLQQTLALSAYGAEVLDDRGVTLSASGAFERNAAYLLHADTGDAYTAARILCSGAAPDGMEAELRGVITGAVRDGEGGLKQIALPEGVLNLRGDAVAPAEALALAARALHPHDPDLARDLLAAALSAYAPGIGFGDAFASAAALDAILTLGGGEPPESLRVALELDGAEIGALELSQEALTEVARMDVVVPAGAPHSFTINADGAWPGLIWHLELSSWVPWGDGAESGLEVALERGELRVNRPVDLMLTASAPRGSALVLRQELPAGLVIDPDSVTGATVESLSDEALVLKVQSGDSGLAEIRYQAIPTFQGALWSGPLSVELEGRPATATIAPPTLWEISG